MFYQYFSNNSKITNQTVKSRRHTVNCCQWQHSTPIRFTQLLFYAQETLIRMSDYTFLQNWYQQFHMSYLKTVCTQFHYLTLFLACLAQYGKQTECCEKHAFPQNQVETNWSLLNWQQYNSTTKFQMSYVFAMNIQKKILITSFIPLVYIALLFSSS